MEKIVEYILDSFGLDVKIEPITSNRLLRLPLYLKHNYQYSEIILLDIEFVLITPIKDADYTPYQLSKHAASIKRVFDKPVIFALDNLNSWERRRMLQKRVAFIQPGKQLYVPSLLLDLNDILNRNIEENIKKLKLSSPAQLAILYHLQVESLESLPYLEIAAKLKYSKMTVTRIMKELSNHDLIETRGSKEKYFVFKYQGKKQLWSKALPIMESPVRQLQYTDDVMKKPFLFSYDTALSEYTMLSQVSGQSYAIWKDTFRNFERESSGLKKIFNKNYGINRVEIWNYDPNIISNGTSVDRLSLYLIMKDYEDERVKGALNELLNQIKW